MNELEEEYAYEEDYRWISGECWYNFASVVVRMDGQKDICPVGIANARFIAAANPAVVLELIAQRDELLAALKGIATAHPNSTVRGLQQYAEAAIAKSGGAE